MTRINTDRNQAFLRLYAYYSPSTSSFFCKVSLCPESEVWGHRGTVGPARVDGPTWPFFASIRVHSRFILLVLGLVAAEPLRVIRGEKRPTNFPVATSRDQRATYPLFASLRDLRVNSLSLSIAAEPLEVIRGDSFCGIQDDSTAVPKKPMHVEPRISAKQDEGRGIQSPRMTRSYADRNPAFIRLNPGPHAAYGTVKSIRRFWRSTFSTTTSIFWPSSNLRLVLRPTKAVPAPLSR